jgi:hypothetical protein
MGGLSNMHTPRKTRWHIWWRERLHRVHGVDRQRAGLPGDLKKQPGDEPLVFQIVAKACGAPQKRQFGGCKVSQLARLLAMSPRLALGFPGRALICAAMESEGVSLPYVTLTER